jgi:hypothetical protein
MILGIDHIAINTSNISLFEKNLLNNNYKCKFKEKIFNSSNKKDFLKYYSLQHLIAYYESQHNCFPIELTEHGNGISSCNTPIYFNKNTITIKVQDIDKEKSFWSKLLGVEKPQVDEISFNSILPKRSFHLRFVHINNNIPYTLDTEGCTCIALITNNINKYVSLFSNEGGLKYVGPWKCEVNKQKIIIAMFQTFGGIIVELIQLESRT